MTVNGKRVSKADIPATDGGESVIHIVTEVIFPLVQITLYLVRSLWLESKHLRIMDDMIGERRRVQP